MTVFLAGGIEIHRRRDRTTSSAEFDAKKDIARVGIDYGKRATLLGNTAVCRARGDRGKFAERVRMVWQAPLVTIRASS